MLQSKSKSPLRTQPNTNVSLADWGLLIIRLMLAVVFIFHGGQKLFGAFGGTGIEPFAGYLESVNVPLPTLNAYLAAVTEFFGGAALLLGLVTRFAVVPMVVAMLVAAFVVHGGAFSAQHGGMEYPLTLAAVLTGIGLTGAGKLSVDACLRAARQPSDSAET